MSSRRASVGTKKVETPLSVLAEPDFFHFFGHHDQVLRYLEKTFGVEVKTRENGYVAVGTEDGVAVVQRLLSGLLSLVRAGYPLEVNEVKFAIRLLKDDPQLDLGGLFREAIRVSGKRPYVFPRSLHQRDYIRAIRKYDLVFGVGPAGTGKTYLAMAMAVSALLRKEIGRIILVRPAVEAGEKLGFLPGDIAQKVHPYLRPLYDALYDMLPADRVSRLIAQDIIEIAPLAYMRGRTLNDSFIILDEAQNTTSEQMKMFLTRLGFNAKALITGDITQIDLPAGKVSGLVEVCSIFTEEKGIEFVFFDETDVVRHELVQRIILAYERASKAGKRNQGNAR